MNWFHALAPTARGIVLMVAAMAIFALQDSIAKYLTTFHHPLQVVWARYASGTLMVFLALAPRVKTLLVTQRLGLQILRSIFLFSATIFFFTAISRIGLARATATFEVAPLIITLLAFLVLGEPVGPRRLIGIGLGLTGALIIVRPGGDLFTIHAALPLGAALFYSAYVVSTRFLSRGESALTSLLYTSIFGAFAASFLVIPVWETPTLPHGALMLFMGVSAGLGHYFVIRAVTLAEAGAVAPFSYAGLVFATLFGLLFFGEWPDGYTLLGALVIVGSGLYVWHRERRADPVVVP